MAGGELWHTAVGVHPHGVGIHAHGVGRVLLRWGAVAHLRRHPRVDGPLGGGVAGTPPAGITPQIAAHGGVAQVRAVAAGVAMLPGREEVRLGVGA